jgi:hypothetical protein
MHGNSVNFVKKQLKMSDTALSIHAAQTDLLLLWKVLLDDLFTCWKWAIALHGMLLVLL